MTKLTTPQLTTVRDLDQYTELYIAKYEPPTMFSARINDSGIVKGARVLTYDSLTFGDTTKLQPGMTLYIGTSAGLGDVGRVRYRSIDTGSSQITVAPDSDIDYLDNHYITIKNFHEFWPVFPRNIANTGTLTYSFYKDYDISLSDENTNFDPVVIMGPNMAGFYDTFSNVYFTATGTYTVDGSTISSYAWVFPTGCSPASSALGTPGNVTFPAAGHYTVSCTVTASNGKTATGYRHVVLLDRYYGNALPITDSAFKDLDGEFGSGYILKIKVRNRANEFKDGDLVILFAEDYYNFSKQSFGGYPGREHVVFAGYVSAINTDFDAFNSESELVIKGIGAYMVNKEMFTLEMYDVTGTPADWSQIQNMTINKMLNHFFRWHTTLLNMADFTHITTAEGAYRDNWVQTSKGEISNIIGDFLKNRVMGALSSDSQGRCFAEIDYQIILTGSRPSSALTFQNTDWVGNPNIVERIEQPVADVLLGGQAYDPPTYTGTAFLSRAPGELQTYNGKSQNVSGLSLTSQQNVNELAGLYYAKLNNRVPEINLDLANNMRNIDIAPQEFYDFTVPANYTYRFGSTAQNYRLLPRKISYKFENFVLKKTVSFETETSGPPGDTIIIPVDVPTDGPEHCEEFPDDCDAPCTGDCGEPCLNCEGDGNTVYIWTVSYVGRTRNYLASSPNWTNISSGLAGTIIDGILDPFDPANTAYTLTSNGVYRCSNLDSDSASWTLVCANATMFSALDADDSKWLNMPTFGNLSASIAQHGTFWVSCGGACYDNDNNGVVDRNVIGAIYTDNAFATVDGHKVDVSTLGDACEAQCYIQASNRLANLAFAVGIQNERFPVVYKTLDFGGTWTQLLNEGSFNNFAHGGEFAYAGSTVGAGEKIMYAMSDEEFGGGPGSGQGEIWQSLDFGGTWNMVKDFPADTPRCSGVRGTQGFTRFINVATWNENDVMFLIKDANNGGGGGAAKAIIARSTDGCSSFDHETSYSGSEWSLAKGLGRWPYNPNRVFVLTESHIYYSDDGGLTMQDKTGDWSTVFGGAFTSPINDVPLWIQP